MTSPPATLKRRSPLLVVALCFAVIVLDGYDLMIFGAIVPVLLDFQEWGLGAGEVGIIGSLTTLGMLVGALLVGTLSDIFGRRRVFLISTIWFSAMTLLSAVAPTPELFGGLRLLAGIGLGGVMPTAIALTVEYAPANRKQFYNAMMFVGYSVGGVLAALLALVLVQPLGFRWLIAFGAIPGILLVPVIAKYLPESMSYLIRRGRTGRAEELSRTYGIELTASGPGPDTGRTGAFRYLLGPQRLRPLVLFSTASFAGLLLVYGLNTWLPQIMRSAGYPLGSSISFLLVLNLGAVVGTIASAALADRVGSRIAVTLAFVAAVITLVGLSLQPSAALLYVFVAMAGLGSIGTQILVNGYAAAYFPAWTRGTAVGITLGVGRLGAVVAPLMVGMILDSNLSFEWNFYAFLLAAALGLVAILLIPREGKPAAQLASTSAAEASATP
ncbi:MFS transporter [Rhodococcus artemisiae]|uniref:Aromatic acid/H+ symport family MFS transporter n=1 Tax=Rhodococcus artemisiae TaxID=714159 RepID=A0ABU7LII3_9NOCA|nr:aromatic acid/H+ symport family MFS transporter [Rhodococcus artemisiae]MEE2061365.1 aromatic acid/H+ symport family MFS transporter [Rhodococcus artemisiae]